MKRIFSSFSALLCLCLLVAGCKNDTTKNSSAHTFTILQLNDVYEIGPVSGGKLGGMARVATVRKQLLSEDSNTITVMAGDFLSPSLLGTLKYSEVPTKDSAIAGRQMVDVMNAVGIDYVTFGNHEFDLPMYRLRARINESAFDWISCNAFRKGPGGKEPFIKYRGSKADTIQPYIIRKISFKDGSIVRLGMIGVTLPFNKADSVMYEDMYTSTRNIYDNIKDQCDIIIAITHLEIGMDSILATRVPGLNLIIGGHEHINNMEKVGNVPICKADDNVKSVYIHQLSWDAVTKKATIQSRLKVIDTTIVADKDVDILVNKWIAIGNASMIAMGYTPAKAVMVTTNRLDGREEKIRTGSTNYTRLITNAMIYATPQADFALFNAGSLRLDDELDGTITEADILRSLPFGDKLVIGDVDGKTLRKIIDTGLANKNSGGYLHYTNLKKNGADWEVSGKPVNDSKVYKVVMPEFVSRGKEVNMSFMAGLKYTIPAELNNKLRNDIRNVIIAYMETDKQHPLWEP